MKRTSFLSLAAVLVLSVSHAATPDFGKSGPDKPLTKKLSAAFGTMHDVVNQSGLIKAIMAGKLTKTQLEGHLEQRALIHELVNQILTTSSARPLPYWRPQRDVVDLLRENLTEMGDPWPAWQDAWPLTQKMLGQIRDSARTGPYYALGVFHVYYGGITHGGRDIGQMIDHQLKTNLTYYSKSDGYDSYAHGVNQITDPAAQREMIRGGVDAYTYIIALNNLPIFKIPN